MIEMLQHGIFHQTFDATGVFRAKSGQIAIGRKAARQAGVAAATAMGLSTSLGKLPQWMRRLLGRAEKGVPSWAAPVRLDLLGKADNFFGEECGLEIFWRMSCLACMKRLLGLLTLRSCMKQQTCWRAWE